MATREYVVGKYEEYYNSLKGELSASSKASEFISEVSRLVTEFNNVSELMNYWKGEAKSAMCTDGINSVMEKFESTQANLEEALAPCCEAIDELSQALTEMKTTEDTWLQKKDQLSSMKNKEPSKTKSNGEDNPEYSTWKLNYDSLSNEVNSMKQKLDGLKSTCDNAIQKIEALKDSLQEFSDYMEMTNSILGIGSTDFSSYTLEERLSYLQELIDNYEAIYDSLNKLYQQKYGHGFKYTVADFKQLDFLFDAFDIYWMSKVDRSNLVKSENGGLIVFDIDNLTKVLSYCNANDVFTKIENYMNGASWKDSGLEDLYSGQFLDTSSANFMNTQAFNESRFKKRLKENYGVTGDAREYLKQNFNSIVSSYETMMKAYGEYQQLAGTMAAVRCKIDSVKEAKKLMPYEINMENSDFKSYLNNDYSGYSLLSQEQLSVMSQQEVALYDYLYHTKSKKEAEAYLKAMENTMNQRIGAYRAAEYVEYLKQGGFGIDDLLASGWEGLKDGVTNFFDGIADIFRVSSTEAGTKTAFDYEMMYKVQYMTELMSDPTYVDQSLSKKTFGFSNITKDFFEKRDKNLRNLSEIGYRLLNFISYSFLFFSLNSF